MRRDRRSSRGRTTYYGRQVQNDHIHLLTYCGFSKSVHEHIISMNRALTFLNLPMPTPQPFGVRQIQPHGSHGHRPPKMEVRLIEELKLTELQFQIWYMFRGRP